jgi:hypothetical protein
MILTIRIALEQEEDLRAELKVISGIDENVLVDILKNNFHCQKFD